MANISRVYNKIYKEYKASESASPYKTHIIEDFRAFLLQTQPHSVLDVGCGSGAFAIAAKQFGIEHVLGIDISLNQIRLACAHAEMSKLDITYQVSDISTLQINREFDVAVSAFGLCYAESKSILQNQLLSIRRHVQAGGSVFFVVCDPDHPVRGWGHNYRTFLEDASLTDGAAIRCEFLGANKVMAADIKVYWTRETWEQLLRVTGYTDIRWHEINSTATNCIVRAAASS